MTDLATTRMDLAPVVPRPVLLDAGHVSEGRR